MKLSEIITDKTRFDVHSKTLVKDMSEKIPSFDGYSGSIQEKKIFQYIILMYDPESPMRREVGHYMQRKNECAESVKFPKEGNRWSDESSDILIGKNGQVNIMIASYIAELAIPEYMELVVLLEIQRVKSTEALNGIINDNTHKIIATVTEGINRLTHQLFGSGEYNEIQAARRALYERTNMDKLRLKPEDVVDRINEDDMKDFNPYGEDYVVEEPHFVGDEEPKE